MIDSERICRDICADIYAYFWVFGDKISVSKAEKEACAKSDSVSKTVKFVTFYLLTDWTHLFGLIYDLKPYLEILDKSEIRLKCLNNIFFFEF